MHTPRGYLFTCLTAGARPGSVEVSGGTLSKRLSTAVGVRLTHGMRSRRAPWRGEAQEGFAQLEVALPSPPVTTGFQARRRVHGARRHRDGPA
jgi:hypothetical protein